MVEGGALLRHCAGNRTEGSNPSLSAIFLFSSKLIQFASCDLPFVRACRAIRDREDSLNLLDEHLICTQLGDILCCKLFGTDRPSLRHHFHPKFKKSRELYLLLGLLFFWLAGDTLDYAEKPRI